MAKDNTISGMQSPELRTYQGTPEQYRVQPVDQDTSFASMALGGLLKLGEQVAGAAFEEDVKSHYMRGSLAAQQGMAIEALESDPFMSRFSTGGYKDGAAKVKMTQDSLDFDRWLETEGHKLAPDDPKVKERLTTLADNVLQSIDGGMTTSAQAQLVQAQEEANLTRVAKHFSSNYAYLVKLDHEQKTTVGNQKLASLQAARKSGDATVHTAALNEVVGYYNSLGADSIMPDGMRKDMQLAYAQGVLAVDDLGTFDALSKAGALDHLPIEAKSSLYRQRDGAQSRLNADEDAAKAKEVSDLFYGAGQGLLSWAQADKVAISKGKSGEWDRSTQVQFYNAMWRGQEHLADEIKRNKGKDAPSEEIARLYAAGEYDKLTALGYTKEKAANVYGAVLAVSEQPIAVRVASQLKVDTKAGIISEPVRDLISQGMFGLGMYSPDKAGGTVPREVEAINTVLGTLKDMPPEQRAAAESTIYQSLSADDAAKFQTASAFVNAGRSAWEGVQKFNTDKTNPAYKEPKAFAPKDIEAAIDAVAPQSTWFAREYTAPQPELVMQVTAKAMELSRLPAYAGKTPQETLAIAAAYTNARAIPIPTKDDKGVFTNVYYTGDIKKDFGVGKEFVGQVLQHQFSTDNPNVESTAITWNRTTSEWEAHDTLVTADGGKSVQTRPFRLNNRGLNRAIDEERAKRIAEYESIKEEDDYIVGGKQFVVSSTNSANVTVSAALDMRKLVLKSLPEKAQVMELENNEAFLQKTDIALHQSEDVFPELDDDSFRATIAAGVQLYTADDFTNIVNKAAELYANPDKRGETMLYLDKSIREDALRDRVKALIFPLHDKRSGATIGGIGF